MVRRGAGNVFRHTSRIFDVEKAPIAHFSDVYNVSDVEYEAHLKLLLSEHFGDVVGTK